MHSTAAVDREQRWQARALQSSLAAARAASAAGDRERAVEAVEAALAIDPDFLAAQALRERLLAPETPKIEVATGGDSLVATGSPVSAEGFARFEQRVRQRRVHNRVRAAREAMSQRRLLEASAALEEIRQLDPDLPELPVLTTALEKARRMGRPRTRRRRWIFAVCVLATIFLGGSALRPWLTVTLPRIAAPTIAAPAAAPDAVAITSEPPAVSVDADSTPTETSEAEIEHDRATPARESVPTAGQTLQAESATPAGPIRRTEPALPLVSVEPVQVAPFGEVTRPLAPAPVPDLPRLPEPSAAGSTSKPATTIASNSSVPSVSAPLPSPTANETNNVREVLQRYRSAYEALDAASAKAVWPGVNYDALARAFKDLESQTLTFQDCDVQLKGPEARDAMAACRGTTRYVARMGSREPRVEPRTWKFTLTKSGSDWKIDTVRTER